MRLIKTKGNFEWVGSEENFTCSAFVPHPDGKYTLHRIEYNWFEKLLIILKILRDDRWPQPYKKIGTSGNYKVWETGAAPKDKAQTIYMIGHDPYKD